MTASALEKPTQDLVQLLKRLSDWSCAPSRGSHAERKLSSVRSFSSLIALLSNLAVMERDRRDEARSEARFITQVMKGTGL